MRIDDALIQTMEVGLGLAMATPEQHAQVMPSPDAPNYEHQIQLLTFAEEWARCGFPRVHIGHKHAASLMATRTPASSVIEIRAPWPAFMIDVPPGLVERDDDVVDSVFVTVISDDVVMLHFNNTAGRSCPIVVGGLRCLGEFEQWDPVGQLLARLVFGVCMELTEHRAAQAHARAVGPRAVTLKRDVPKTMTFQLTRNVKVDCRAAVRDYARGLAKSSPIVQSLVRGHWKQQRCGKGGAERKNIFVEPYWRGPEDAPVALRKHDIVDPPEV